VNFQEKYQLEFAASGWRMEALFSLLQKLDS